MRTASLLILLASARSILGYCDDSCASAITAIGEIDVGLQSRSRDCAQFLATTVTPNASIALITTSANMEDYLHVPSPKSTAPGLIPTYASACAASADYASACACAAVTPTTVVAPTPTTYLYDELPLCNNPATCAQGYAKSSCGGGAGICVPGGGEDGSGFCIATGNCGLRCARNSDCLTGICLTDVCCGSSCSNPSVQFVTTWAPPRAKLAKKGFSSLSDIISKIKKVKTKLLGATHNTILGPYLPENPQPLML
ncbi:hypothetical protein SBOR_1841 [Sclerotinia borealis F-4128]|uniref:Uncharacterized protein n=1 Tax=Sclerotinia borealis (strain F-4128) TaxID=1432307 RepID=W9CT44_SCLBF|nr:hypothetical protein SBOR_1841 [Sclerotinia borealis F-4128]